MARRLAVAGVAFALALLAPTAHAEKRPPCSHGGSTETKNDLVRVYELSDGDDHELKACYLRTRKRTTLDSWFDCGCSVGDEPSPDHVWLGGRFVAVETHTATGPPGAGGPASSTFSVELFDAKLGKSLRTLVASPERLLIKPTNGSIAYSEGFVLHALEHGGGDKVLDPGPIKASSLKLKGSTLSWTKNGQSFSATLH